MKVKLLLHLSSLKYMHYGNTDGITPSAALTMKKIFSPRSQIDYES
jgi:hypothetical protein